jgi:chemotaxis signal transduction protein
VLLRFRVDADGDALCFVPAEVARRLTALSSLTDVPGARPPIAGIALADGAVVTVLRIGQPAGSPPAKPSYQPGEDWVVPGADRAVLCHLGGFDVALTGATVLATGVFDVGPEGDGVLWRGEVVPILDVRALYAQAEATTWAERAVTSVPRAGGGR